MTAPSFFFSKKSILLSLTATLMVTSLWAGGSDSDSNATDTDEEFFPETAPGRRRPVAAHSKFEKILQAGDLFEGFPLNDVRAFSSPAQIDSFLQQGEGLIHAARAQGNGRDVHLVVTDAIQIVLALLKREIEHRTRLKDGPFSCSPYLPAWPEEGGPNPFSPVPSEKEWGDIGATGHMPLGQQGSLEEGGNLPDHVPVFPLTPHSIWSPGASDNLGGWVGSFANLSVSSAKPATNDLQEEAEDDVPALVAPPQEFEDERPVSQEFEEEEDQGPRSEVYAKGIEADHEGDSTENEEEDEEGHEGGASDLEDVQLPPDDDAARWAAEQINRWNTWSLLGYPPEQDRSSAASVESFQDLNAIGRQSSNALTEEGFKLAHNAIREDMRATLMDLVEQLSQLDVPAFMPPAPAPFEDEAEAVDSNA